jgi:hypothetical protein
MVDVLGMDQLVKEAHGTAAGCYSRRPRGTSGDVSFADSGVTPRNVIGSRTKTQETGHDQGVRDPNNLFLELIQRPQP